MPPSTLLKHATFYHCRRSLSSASLSSLRNELTTRRLPLAYDYLTPQQSHLLNLSLSGFISPPPHPSTSNNATTLPSTHRNPPLMPPGHHLVYFPPQIPSSHLLPDGTDTLHYPGPPFNRRLWAGGYVRFYGGKGAGGSGPLRLNGQRAVCLEGIRDVTIKGREGEEKVFVAVERRVAAVEEGEQEEEVRRRVWTEDEKEAGDAVVVERRDLVFLRDREIEGVDEGGRRIVKPPSSPTLAHSLTPTRSLLFRFSALTFNAHAIHLDRTYARNIEGYPDLLVHGPLTLTLMLTVLQNHLSSISGGQAMIAGIEYRNLAPLVVERVMRICAKPKGKNGDGDVAGVGAEAWEIWVEGTDGGLAVRGTVYVQWSEG
ncbi:hypothetical protein AJ79_06653 [Helicocarpus griseus UAMH5409]|uniref:MaoC-like domain-containing protein n=1 Tax=Helicocarpus griseus UAMH5409 TaxID=1447875 RepID=A0A2B7X2U1_9EURO|nr:hypothetical protein AJ79_06653 [Helicocarpus griseus UAMH5409]